MDLNQVLTELKAGVRAAFSNLQKESQARQGAEALIRQELNRQQQDLQTLSQAMEQVRGSASGGTGGPIDIREGLVKLKDSPHIRYISQIPGRRQPYDLICPIAIGSDVTSMQEQSKTISQDGPFIVTGRGATFQSTAQFTVADTEAGTTANFQARSYGRFRPISSVNDYNDSQAFNPITGLAPPGTGAAIYASPSNHSGFRTMQFDGWIQLIMEGSGWPRSNDRVPTSLWMNDNNSILQLGSFDFLERGTTVKFDVTPSHVNNPPAGNVNAFAGASGVFPGLASQYDVHEGILDPYTSDDVTSDPVTRLPQGILFIWLHGFRILQPPGPVRLV